MRLINRISRCGILYRSDKLTPYGINGYQNVYIQNICKYPGVSQEQLSKIIIVNKSNVARQVAALEKDGFLIRKTCESDKRQLNIYPTEKALELNPVIHEVLEGWNKNLLEDFTPEEQEKLREMLEKILNKAVALVSEPEETV
jgi:DNA-binding MarR family transcriptional regulator